MTKKETANKLVKKWRNVITESKEYRSPLDNQQMHNMIKDFAEVDSSPLNRIVLRYAIAWSSLNILTTTQAEQMLRDITNYIYN